MLHRQHPPQYSISPSLLMKAVASASASVAQQQQQQPAPILMVSPRDRQQQLANEQAHFIASVSADADAQSSLQQQQQDAFAYVPTPSQMPFLAPSPATDFEEAAMQQPSPPPPLQLAAPASPSSMADTETSCSSAARKRGRQPNNYERISDPHDRQSRAGRRTRGIMNKAAELDRMHGHDVLVVVASDNGSVTYYASSNGSQRGNSFRQVVERERILEKLLIEGRRSKKRARELLPEDAWAAQQASYVLPQDIAGLAVEQASQVALYKTTQRKALKQGLQVAPYDHYAKFRAPPPVEDSEDESAAAYAPPPADVAFLATQVARDARAFIDPASGSRRKARPSGARPRRAGKQRSEAIASALDAEDPDGDPDGVRALELELQAELYGGSMATPVAPAHVRVHVREEPRDEIIDKFADHWRVCAPAAAATELLLGLLQEMEQLEVTTLFADLVIMPRID